MPLEFQAPPELEAVRARLSSIPPGHFDDIAQRVGSVDTGLPVRVILADEKSEWVRGVAPWIAGFAIGRSGLIVIFPARTPSYPHSSLEDVLRHELAHILITRAAAGGDVPRWFNEGLAMSAEREWHFEDQGRVLLYVLSNPQMSIEGLNRAFSGDEQAQKRAYALAGAFVRQLMQMYGENMPGQVLANIRGGMSFEAAFRYTTGVQIVLAEAEFWRSQRLWSRWVPIITSSAALWLVVTFLALLAIRRRRQKDADFERKWAEEDGDIHQ